MWGFVFILFFVGGLCQNVNQSQNNTGEDQNIERPCNIFDTNCIRRYFAKNSICKPKYGHVPDPLYKPQSKVHLPRLNVTVDLRNVMYRGLNGRIQEFYVNRETDKVVISVEFRNLYTASNNTFWRFYRRAREPIITKDYFYINLQSLAVTMVIPQRKNLQLQRGESFTFIDDAIQNYGVGPRIFMSSDSTVQTARVEFIENMSLNIIEALLTEGSFFIATFIQYTLCDFGLKLL